MYILYDLFFLGVFIFGLVYYFLKAKFHRDILLRIKLFKMEFLSGSIWIHAVSVGEAKIAKVLYFMIKDKFPEKTVVISTVTRTGNKIVKSFISGSDKLIYFPLDFSFIVKSFIKTINPNVFISIETEIWPNLFYFLNKNNTPIIILNGRISPASFMRYKVVRGLFKNVLKKVSLFCMQTQTDADRIVSLGADSEKVIKTGSIKFDIAIKEDIYFKNSLGINEDELVFLAGSTHPGEELIIFNVFKNIKRQFPNLKLVLAPRHTERVETIEALLRNMDLSFIRFSAVSGKMNEDIIIVDIMGKLAQIYAAADVVFVGGSLIKKGGQNILEPAFFAKPIIFGPFMFNFSQISELFIKENAAKMVFNQEELYETVKELLEDNKKRFSLGLKAKEILDRNKGALQDTFSKIEKFL
ncbi:MAG: 3-deoxy-D-manno-octulosonic acid transferase [Candidatus Gygaella obscura]|nr:3-deoxy-D-manno-octulosonic acid transferase [Candidatus Gygaella obscura]